MLLWILGLVLAAIIAAALILVVTPIRRNLISKPLFAWFKTVMPPMSETEQEAIAAGDTWHEANLFQGRPQWQQFLQNPKPTLTPEEQDFLDNEVERFCEMLDEWQIVHKDYDFPESAWNYLKTAGFLGLHVPKKYGGKNFSALASSTVVQKIATKSLSAAVSVMVPNSLGPAELILHYGTEDQKNKYLHLLAKGLAMPCFALTAPDAGSDATSITDSGEICYGSWDGKDQVLGIKLNFSKRYITLAPIANLIGLAVKLSDPQQLLGTKTELGITVVLLENITAGVEIGARHYPLNQAFFNGPIRGRNVFVPLDNIIGGQKMIGHGWKMLVECLASGRGISLPALSTALGKHCYRVTGAYAKLRQQFKVSIGNFEGVATAMARIAGHTYMLEATRLLTLSAIDQKFKPSVITAISKYHMTEMSRVVINDAMDVHGGRGIMMGPRNYLATSYEGVPISITVEGANILTRCLMIFGQGAIRCHPYVLRELNAVKESDPQRALAEFDAALFKHICYALANFSKLKVHSLSGAHFCEAPEHAGWKRYYQWLSFFSIALACSADLGMLVLGGNLKRKENLSARLGDVLSYLYIASAVLKYNYDYKNDAADYKLTKWSLDFCLYKIQESFDYFYLNLDSFMGKIISCYISPPWRNFRMPSDKLAIEISKDMMQPSLFRERLTSHCVVSKSADDPVARVELAWLEMVRVTPLIHKLDEYVRAEQIDKNLRMFHRIQAALDKGFITNDEAAALNHFETLRLDAIQVDEFTEAQLKGLEK
jgi:alkylation response protein AidB-like acyl-CoA dehydrogenase